MKPGQKLDTGEIPVLSSPDDLFDANWAYRRILDFILQCNQVTQSLVSMTDCSRSLGRSLRCRGFHFDRLMTELLAQGRIVLYVSKRLKRYVGHDDFWTPLNDLRKLEICQMLNLLYAPQTLNKDLFKPLEPEIVSAVPAGPLARELDPAYNPNMERSDDAR